MMEIPALRYAKAPAGSVSELYERYPNGVEGGSFAFVHDANAFYVYHTCGEYRGQWRPIGGGTPLDPTNPGNPGGNDPANPGGDEQTANITVRAYFYEEEAGSGGAAPSALSINPAWIEVAADDTAGRSVAVASVDNTWNAVAGDASWATVTKVSPTRAEVVLTANEGDLSRSQQITFSRRDVATGQTETRVLHVGQLAAENPVNTVRISGQVVQGEGGAPVAGVAVSLLATSTQHGFANDYPIETVTTDGEGGYAFEWAIQREVWDYISRFKLMAKKEGWAAVSVSIDPVPDYDEAVANGITVDTLTLEQTNDITVTVYFTEEI